MANLVASVFGEMHMDTLSGAGLGARRNEDIALDLLKFVAGTAGVGKTGSALDGIYRSGRDEAGRTREPTARRFTAGA